MYTKYATEVHKTDKGGLLCLIGNVANNRQDHPDDILAVQKRTLNVEEELQLIPIQDEMCGFAWRLRSTPSSTALSGAAIVFAATVSETFTDHCDTTP